VTGIRSERSDVMQDKFISTPSGKIHAKVAGAGDVVILIHGRSVRDNSWRTWDKNIDSLAKRWRVYALDLLGYGESDKPEPLPEAQSQARAIIELMDAEKIDRANVVGLSWGGAIAQIIATTAPERVNKLVLVDSAYDDSDKGRERLLQIKCPTLIVWDEDDAVIPVEGASILARAIPNSQVHIFKRAERDQDADPNNQHWSQKTHSNVWNRTVAAFLANRRNK
jgi:pimeloyl-ACP methyl ester carboxylesterase